MKKNAILALLLLVPAPSIGTLSAMVLFPNSFLGAAIFAFSKLWLFGLPVVWHRFVDKAEIGFSPARQGGYGVGLLSGGVISLGILLGYVALGDRLLDGGLLVRKMTDIGLASWPRYLGGAAYWILVNSVLEEYVWRWFVVKKCETLFSPRMSIFCAALFFTIHHAVALQVYCGPVAVVICSLGVFVGGATWSLMYLRYRSIWPGYLSHAIVDLCVFGIGAWIIFR